MAKLLQNKQRTANKNNETANKIFITAIKNGKTAN